MRTVSRLPTWGRLLATSMVLVSTNACDIDRPTGVRPHGNASGTAIGPAAAADVDSPTDYIFGPESFTRGSGAPTTQVLEFYALPSSKYVAEIADLAAAEAVGEVALNGQVLLPFGRTPNVGIGRREAAVALGSWNSVTVNLVGKPGTGLRVGIRALQPVTLDATTLRAPGPIEVDGDGARYDYTLSNYTRARRPNIRIEAWVIQGAVSRYGGGQPVQCGDAVGVVAPGTCTGSARFSTRVTGGGVGTLVPGSADVRIQLLESRSDGMVVLGTVSIPITLIAMLPPSVTEIIVSPQFVQMGVGNFVQLAADVQVTGNASKAVTWSSSDARVAAVTSTGKVIAVSEGSATITAASVADPTMKAWASIRTFQFRITSPSGPVSVSTGATVPPANPLSVSIRAETCGPTAVFIPNISRVEFYARVGVNTVTIGWANINVIDTGAPDGRCWFASMVWRPGTAFGVGPQVIYAVGFANDGTSVVGTPLTYWITTTNP